MAGDEFVFDLLNPIRYRVCYRPGVIADTSPSVIMQGAIDYLILQEARDMLPLLDKEIARLTEEGKHNELIEKLQGLKETLQGMVGDYDGVAADDLSSPNGKI